MRRERVEEIATVWQIMLFTYDDVIEVQCTQEGHQSHHISMIFMCLVTDLCVVVCGYSLQVQVFADSSLVWRGVVIRGAHPDVVKELMK